ncbi:outer membrane protein assembly factor BamE [Enterobacter sp. ECC-175]|uniref:outer membrane protein assembly factor BamE domain-containing protein n=1 Tax=Enterobacter sp. ECC-175 TaxID=3116479 RepID=UPI0037549C3E
MVINTNKIMLKKISLIILGFFVICTLNGCVGNIDRTQEGNVSKYSKEELLKKLVPGKTTKKDVLLILGAPTTPANYNDENRWLYFSKTKGMAIYAVVPVSYNNSLMLILNFDEKKTLISREYKKL